MQYGSCELCRNGDQQAFSKRPHSEFPPRHFDSQAALRVPRRFAFDSHQSGSVFAWQGDF